MYGARGGRIYCTTLAALTLEVYYRYLRLYDKPNLPADTKAGEEAADGGGFPTLVNPHGDELGGG